MLTRGDGAHGVSRLASTTTILAHAGCRPGTVYGRLEDREIYRAVLDRNVTVFEGLVDEIVRELVALDIDYLVADAEEGYNPSHDVCRYVAGAAALAASHARSQLVRDFDFPLIAAPDTCPEDRRSAAIRLTLDDEAHARKLRAAYEYPELKGEVDRALEVLGAGAFRIECLRPVAPDDRRGFDRPFYEEHGERQVARGLYDEVIRYDQHVRPIRDGLRAAADAVIR